MKKLYVKYIFLFMLLALPLYSKGQKYNFTPIDKEFDSIASKLCRMDFENARVKIETKDLDKLSYLKDIDHMMEYFNPALENLAGTPYEEDIRRIMTNLHVG